MSNRGNITLKRRILGILFSFSFMLFVLSPELGHAEKFFKTHSTWYEKIPVNPEVMPNSPKYVNFIRSVMNGIAVSKSEWSVPVFYANINTPKYDVIYKTSSQLSREAIANNGWNLNVPIPLEAKQAGYGSSTYKDGHLVIISYDNKYAWDFFRANVDGKPLDAYRVKRWDLSGDGIDQPYTYAGARVSPIPLLHGLITYKEIQSGYIDHALAFSTHSAKTGSPGVYPCVTSNSGESADPWAPWLGFRFQLDPTVDINSLGLNEAGRIIAKAMQEYGMIFIENQGPGNNAIYAEDLDHKPESWNGIIGSLGGIPMDKLRVVEPIIPSPNGGSDPAPSPPQGLQFAK